MIAQLVDSLPPALLDKTKEQLGEVSLYIAIRHCFKYTNVTDLLADVRSLDKDSLEELYDELLDAGYKITRNQSLERIFSASYEREKNPSVKETPKALPAPKPVVIPTAPVLLDGACSARAHDDGPNYDQDQKDGLGEWLA